MELIYLYIEDDERNIKNCEFNFSPKYNIHYDRSKEELTINMNDNYIENFWDASNILNITAIIGKNGTGKSNLIQCLVKNTKILSTYEEVSVMSDFIYVYETNRKLEIKTTISIKTNKKESIELIKQIEQVKVICYPCIYYNPNIYQDISFDTYKGKASIDVSEKRMIIVDSENFIREDSHYANNIWLYHKYGNTLRQLDFLSKYNDLQINNLRLPKKCFLRCEFLPVFNHIPNDNEAKNFYNRIKTEANLSFIRNENKDVNVLTLFPLYYTLIFELYCYCRDMGIFFNWDDYHYDTITNTFKNEYNSEIGQILLDINLIIGNCYYEYDEHQHGYYVSINTAKKFFSKYFELISIYRNNISQKVSNKTAEFPPSKSLFDSKISVEWEYNMSSGEQMYLNLMSNLYYAKINLNPMISNLFLLLDEPESSFHPEWQRQFMSNLIAFVKEVFTDINVQIILTSHSPIIVSDFPKNNIIFLDIDKEENCKVIKSITQDNTFGSNIHTLYKNSFFLNGLPIGEFAKVKIDRLFKELQAGIVSDKIYKEIQLIGEPLLKNQLVKMYNGYLHNNVNKRVTELEREIENLKKQLNDKD
jgi:predicted ATPase